MKVATTAVGMTLLALTTTGHAADAAVEAPASVRAVPTRNAALALADSKAVRATVESQLAAIAIGDADRAFAFATPELRRQFGNAGNFMALVRQAYPMVIRPAAAVFFVPLPDGNGVLQQVQLRDAGGRLWLASYRLSRQPEGAWRIEGCSVVADTWRRST